MGYLGDQSAVVYRDSRTQGVPASGPHEPNKPDIRGLFYFLDGALAELVAAFVADQAVVVYAARSSLYGNLAPADRTLGLVYNDGANNGLYIKNGASGSGSWASTGLMLQGQKGDAATLAVGSVTSGSAPAVTNSGTASAAILDFVLQRGADGKSFLQTAIDSGYVPAGTTEAQLTTKIVGQISAAAAASASAAALEATRATSARIASEAARDLSLINATTSDTAKAAVLQAIGQVPSTAVLQMPAATRDILRGFTNMVAGSQAYLGEAGRTGTWQWAVGGYSAQVAADPDEGLYLKATSVPASQGVWRRVVAGMAYHTSWWGVGPGFVDTQVTMPQDYGDQGSAVPAASSRTLQYMHNLLPSGATIYYPVGGRSAPVQAAAFIEVGQKSIQIVGVPGSSWITGKPGSAAFNEGCGIFHLNGSGSSVYGMGFENFLTEIGHTPPSCIVAAGIFYANRQGNPVSDIEVSHCHFVNASDPCIIYDSPWSRTDPNGYQRTRNVRIHDNIYEGVDFYYQSFYGVDGVRFYNNRVQFVSTPDDRQKFGCRIIGSYNVFINNVYLEGPGYSERKARCFEVKNAANPQSIPGQQSLPGGNIHISNVTAVNWPCFVEAGDRVDGLYISDITAINTTLPTDATAPYDTVFFRGSEAGDFGDLVVRNITVRGYDALYSWLYGFVRRFDWRDIQFRSAGRINYPMGGLASLTGVDCGDVVIQRVDVEYPALGGSLFAFQSCKVSVRAWDNVGPESFYAPGDARTQKIIGIDNATNGTIVTTPSGPLTSAQDYRALAYTDASLSRNVLAAPGTWAAASRDPVPGQS